MWIFPRNWTELLHLGIVSLLHNTDIKLGKYGLPAWVWGWFIAGVLPVGALAAVFGTEAHLWVSASSGRNREASLSVPRSGKAGFNLIDSRESGVVFSNHVPDSISATNQIPLIGSGVAAGDVNGDGFTDLYFCGIHPNNELYLNRGGFRFEAVADKSGVACTGQWSTGCVLADVDGDGDLDLLVSALGKGVRLFTNDGSGRFEERTGEAGLRSAAASTSMALADFDGDGDLDLYVANYRLSSIRSGGQISLLMVNGKETLRPEDKEQFLLTSDGLKELGEPDVLYVNDGTGRFMAADWTGGVFLDEEGQTLQTAPRDWGLSVIFRDFNGDGAPDIYVCNDFWTPDRFWINDGKGHLRAAPHGMLRSTSTFSMGVDVADLDRDGRDDFLVLDMRSRLHRRRMTQQSMIGGVAHAATDWKDTEQVERNTLFWNRGANTYYEIGQLTGLDATEWSWCPIFLDVDLDGYEDLLVTHGHGFDMQDTDTAERNRIRSARTPEEKLAKLLEHPRLPCTHLAFRNQGGWKFSECGSDWGFNLSGVSEGMCLADLDNDGDMDVVINRMDAPAALLRNESDAPRIAVRLRDDSSRNRYGVGAHIKVVGGPVIQTQEILSGGRYLSGDEAQRVFAAGTTGSRLAVEVRWRDGRLSSFTNLEPNHAYEFHAPPVMAAASVVEGRQVSASSVLPLFMDRSRTIRHSHHQVDADDFARQRLLPRRFSRSGPSLAWIDLNADGRDDLVIGGSTSNAMTLLLNGPNAGFRVIKPPSPLDSLPGDAAGMIGWFSQSGVFSLLTSVSPRLDEGSSSQALLQTEVWAGGIRSATGMKGEFQLRSALSVGSLGKEGVFDIFVGARHKPGHYPESGGSRLLRHSQGFLSINTNFDAVLESAGSVSAALFSDLNGDGASDLLLASEWGSLHLYRNEEGSLRDVTREVGLAGYTGLWQGVCAGDFDNDGRLDIVAANWGRNSVYEPFLSKPLQLWTLPHEGDEGLVLMEAGWDPTANAYVPLQRRYHFDTELPWLRESFPTHAAFSEATVPALFGTRTNGLRMYSASTLDSMLFLNRGAVFEAVPLPMEAQIAPAFCPVVADFDGDGNEDLFLSQNLYGVHSSLARLDGGRGLVLLGDGQGHFRVLRPEESGVQMYGEQRAAAVADVDLDGRVDLAVAQNDTETKLYMNSTGKPGLRVRLGKEPKDPSILGAKLRVGHAGRWGPVREIRAGGGYLSQDSLMPVMAVFSTNSELQVQWPGGRITVSALPANAREVVVSSDGSIRMSR